MQPKPKPEKKMELKFDHDGWCVVARQSFAPEAGNKCGLWCYDCREHEIGAIRAAVKRGELIQAQRRNPAGHIELVCRESQDYKLRNRPDVLNQPKNPFLGGLEATRRGFW